MREPSPITFLFGVALGFIARPIIMGCFSSKEESIAVQKPPTYQSPQPTPISQTQPYQQMQHHLQGQQVPQQVPQAPVPQKQDVVSLPRPVVTYGEREKNELKVKNLRDKLETTIITSEQVLQDEAKIAVKMHKEGNKAHARVLLRRRRHTHKKIENCQTMLATVMEMIQSMDTARDNAKFIQAVESGTKAIKEVMDGMSVERVHQALGDARQAEEYTNEIGAALRGDEDVMDDDEFEREVAEMTQRYAAPEAVREEVKPDMGVVQTPANVIVPEPNAELVNADANMTEGIDQISSLGAADDVTGEKISSFSGGAETVDEKIALIPKLPTELPPEPPAAEPVENEYVEPAAMAM